MQHILLHGSPRYCHKLYQAPCVAVQVSTGSAPAELRPITRNPRPAAGRPAGDSGARPAARTSPARNPSSTGDSSSPEALPGAPPHARESQLEEGRAGKAKSSGKKKQSGSSSQEPPPRDYAAAATTMAHAGLLNRWQERLFCI